MLKAVEAEVAGRNVRLRFDEHNFWEITVSLSEEDWKDIHDAVDHSPATEESLRLALKEIQKILSEFECE